MVLSIGERIKGFLFSPKDTFDASKEDSLGDAFKYFFIILVIYAVLSAIIAAVVISMLSGMSGVPETPFDLAMGPALAVGVFIGLLVVGILGIIIGGVWLHLWVYLMGGRNGLVQTIKAVIYGDTPSLLLGWIPVLNGIAMIWSLIVGIIGVRQLHGLSTGKAALAVILAILIPAIIIGILIVALAPMMPEPGYPGLAGPEFGGF